MRNAAVVPSKGTNPPSPFFVLPLSPQKVPFFISITVDSAPFPFRSSAFRGNQVKKKDPPGKIALGGDHRGPPFHRVAFRKGPVEARRILGSNRQWKRPQQLFLEYQKNHIDIDDGHKKIVPIIHSHKGLNHGSENNPSEDSPRACF